MVEKLIEENEYDRKRGLALLLHALICCVMGGLSRDLLSFFIYLFIYFL